MKIKEGKVHQKFTSCFLKEPQVCYACNFPVGLDMTISSYFISALRCTKRAVQCQVACLYFLDAMMNGNYKETDQNGMTVVLMSCNITC